MNECSWPAFLWEISTTHCVFFLCLSKEIPFGVFGCHDSVFDGGCELLGSGKNWGGFLGFKLHPTISESGCGG